MPVSDRIRRLVIASTAGLAVVTAPGCMALTPQLPPTDYAALEKVEDRGERERLYAESAIVRHEEPQGTRYTKGSDPNAEKRSWQSLDAVLRSDQNSSQALPVKKLRAARILTALAIAASIVTIAGISASAREGLDLKDLNGTGGILLGGGLATVALGISAGIVYSKARRDYDRAVDIYNDSLGVRLGIYGPDGKYIPPRGVLVDEEGYIILDEPERAVTAPAAAPGPTPPPVEPPPAAGETIPAEPTAPPASKGTPPPSEPTQAPAEPSETPPATQRPRTSTPPATIVPPPSRSGLSLRMRP